jgi:hypothetical protein
MNLLDLLGAMDEKTAMRLATLISKPLDDLGRIATALEGIEMNTRPG